MSENLPNRIKYWLTEAKHDCFFVVGPENESTERIGALKILLMGDSEPFRAMLQDSELAEKGDIRVTDTDPQTFKNFLKCVYGGNSILIPQLTFEECVNLLYVTDKYLINYLKVELTERVKNLFAYDLIFVALSHPICYQECVTKEILNILKYDFIQIARDKQFLELNHAAITWILQQNTFLVKEVEIWNAVLQWAQHKTGSKDGKIIRLFILDLLKFIRFLTMDQAEFWEAVVFSEVLLPEEVNDICRAVYSGEPCSFEHLCKSRKQRFNMGQESMTFRSNFMETPRFAFIRCSVNSISDLPSYDQTSKTYLWAGHLWYLLIGRRRENKKEFLGVFVGCEGQTQNWNCSADIEIILLNQTGKSDKTSKCTHTFSPSERDWGFRSFHDWNSLLSSENGFVKGNNIILIIKIKLKNT